MGTPGRFYWCCFRPHFPLRMVTAESYGLEQIGRFGTRSMCSYLESDDLDMPVLAVGS